MDILFSILGWMLFIFCASKLGSIFDKKFNKLEKKIDELGHKIDSITERLNRFGR